MTSHEGLGIQVHKWRVKALIRTVMQCMQVATAPKSILVVLRLGSGCWISAWPWMRRPGRCPRSLESALGIFGVWRCVAQRRPRRWPHSDVAGDCRYWATSSFALGLSPHCCIVASRSLRTWHTQVMSFCGPEECRTVSWFHEFTRLERCGS